ncbi:serine/threonine protein kinase [Microtetraspora niveoalba]|uniref:serine/threonine protein kinase n=1 Tax=Microtetraspora niveoalba TaxID=46175 RepID=UPI00082D0097|nr:serine/threonine-protein kinase [Microtetraspora niveoalba]
MALGEGDPERLGPFELVDRLGEGGQGIVYLGRGPAGEQVAVKLLHTRFAADQEARHRFLREVALAQRVARFCTAPVLHADLAGNQPYIVSEYVPGPSLRQLVDKEGPRRGAALERLAISTATALAAIHRAGITHRDFKPANVLMGPEGPVVIDFGVARALDSPQATATGATMGTPSYLAPELLSGGGATGAADVFAWGVTMVFAATGTPAFGADSIPSVITRILSIEPDVSALTPPLRDLVAACLSKDPARRPTADDVVAALTGGPGAYAPPPAHPAAPVAAHPGAPAGGPAGEHPARPGQGPQAAPPSHPGPGAPGPSHPGRPAAPGTGSGRKTRSRVPILAGVGGAVVVAAITAATVVTTQNAKNVAIEQSGTPVAEAADPTSAADVPSPDSPRTGAPTPSPSRSPRARPGQTRTAPPVPARQEPAHTPATTRGTTSKATSSPRPSASAVLILPTGGPEPSPVRTPAPAKTTAAPKSTPTKTAAPSPKPNPYTAAGVCGSGFRVIDSHGWGGKATTYLLYNASTGSNCVITMSKYVVPGKIKMGAVLKVKNGSSISDWGSYTTYAGPKRLAAKGKCVIWGGGYGSAAWNSAWSHCG